MPGLDPGIHLLLRKMFFAKEWIAGASPAMTPDYVNRLALMSGLGVGHQHRLVAIAVRKHLLEVFDLGQVEARDIGLVRMLGGVVLVIILRRIKRLRAADLGDDRLWKHFGGVELRHIGLGDLLLRVVLRENLGAIL